MPIDADIRGYVARLNQTVRGPLSPETVTTMLGITEQLYALLDLATRSLRRSSALTGDLWPTNETDEDDTEEDMMRLSH
jgi:hypothetical protein